MPQRSSTSTTARLTELQDTLETHGACFGQFPSDWFFPDDSSTGELHQRGVLVCQSCPVRDSCLEYAQSTKAEMGVWGGCQLGPRTTITQLVNDAEFRARRQQRARRQASLWLAWQRFARLYNTDLYARRESERQVNKLAQGILDELESGTFPEELLDEAARWQETRDEQIVDRDPDLPQEFIDAVERAWEKASQSELL